MSSAWRERQGQVGEIQQMSRVELQELLLRQEKILANKRLLKSLPDKGEKISEFAERVRLAIQNHDEEESRQSLVFAARTKLQSKYQQAFSGEKRLVLNKPAFSNPNTNEPASGNEVNERQSFPVSAQMAAVVFLVARETEIMETGSLEPSQGSEETIESDLAGALEKVRLSETSSKSKESPNCKERQNYFLKTHSPKKPHYVTILERTEKASGPGRQKFKLNQLPPKGENSPSGSSSPSQSSERSSPLSVQEKRERNRRHLNEITAATLPPLYHNPAQLLSLDESAILLKEQTKKQQELQAKLAAQKLSEGLRISMGSYTPDGGPMAAYREVHDDGAQLSSEED
ncbi:protein GRINL1A [Cynoglossus semilaevis]|uniref:RNA polymerase II subunit M n=1 Tax=Cynoglossus semilaevis TaxID=244447 RepID=A0A3P8WSY4_CYNSE|nr:protein GRINL1A [Cynoglossus semilaevis]